MQMMHRLFGTEFEEYLHTFVDDLLIFSKSREEHIQHLETVFAILRENGLHVKPSKCILGVAEIEYCGTIISAKGVKADPEKVAAIKLIEQSKNKRDVQYFLGSINWLREYIPKVTEVALPLAFAQLKQMLVDAPTLRHYYHNLETALFTDASLYAIGGWIELIFMFLFVFN